MNAIKINEYSSECDVNKLVRTTNSGVRSN